jgi:hypothetical protein
MNKGRLLFEGICFVTNILFIREQGGIKKRKEKNEKRKIESIVW